MLSMIHDEQNMVIMHNMDPCTSYINNDGYFLGHRWGQGYFLGESPHITPGIRTRVVGPKYETTHK